MSIEQITARICAFRDARDWMQFHSPKELAIAITAEAGEADVGILLFELAHNLGVDLGQAMLDKIERNETRYPVAKARGSNAKYNEL
jgi:NTP pyrophosphatase (non-canonical NTP hydrolase)